MLASLRGEFPLPDPSSDADLEDAVEYLRGVSFPVEGNSLLSAMLSRGAPDELVRKIHRANRSRYDGSEAVLAVIRGP